MMMALNDGGRSVLIGPMLRRDLLKLTLIHRVLPKHLLKCRFEPFAQRLGVRLALFRTTSAG